MDIDERLEGSVPAVFDLGAEQADWACEMPLPHRLNEIANQTGRDTLEMRSWITAVSIFSAMRRGSKSWELWTLQLRDVRLDRAGTSRTCLGGMHCEHGPLTTRALIFSAA